LKYLQFLSDRYFTFAKKYHEFPTLQLLITIVKDDLKGDVDTSLRDQVIDYLQRMKQNPDPGDLPFIKEKSLDFCKKQALKEALEKTIDLVATEKYDNIVEIIKTAVAVGQVPSVGHDFMKDMDARFVTTKRSCVPTGYMELDRKEIFNGGLGQGELGVVTATTGVGKSHFLVSLGAAAVMAGKNVVHYTLELSETNVGLRYDSHICDIPSNEVVENKEDVKKVYESMKGMGRLIIKEYPANTCSIFTIRSHIERLQLKGFSPDLIIIDYADIMRSTREYDSLRHELKLIYEELRSYASELQIPVWTASQANRDASQSDIISAESMSESYGKAMTADVIVTVSRKVAEKASGWGRLYIAKNELAEMGSVTR
jgi:Replicative DNA helicase